MKKSFLFLLLAVSLSETKAADHKKNNVEPDVYINKLWVDHNETVNGKLGMRIHVAFTATDMQNQDMELRMFVKYDDDIPDNYIRHAGVSDNYHLDSGYLSVRVTGLKPAGSYTTYDNVAAFLPYDEFRLAPGEYDLIVDVYAVRANGQYISWLDFYAFQFTEVEKSRGASSKKSSSRKSLAPSAQCDSMWVEFDVTENNLKGMKIHYKFVVNNMKDSAGYVFAQFQYADGRAGAIKDKNGKYNTNHGGTCTYATIKPGFETAGYNDYVLFMPYDELELSPGVYRLVIDTRVLLNNGDLVATFPFYSFTFTK